LKRHHHETADGADLYWEEEGQGPRVLLVHGGTGTGAFDWELVRPRLVHGHHLMVIDLRGHGRSSDPARRLSLEQIGADVLSLLEETGGCDAIMAFSIGASAMLALLCERPTLTRAFVCIGASTAGDIDQVEAIVNGPWPADLRGLRHQHSSGEDHWRRLRSTLAHSWAGHRLSDEQLAGLEVPTLVVCGDRDRVEPVETALSLSRSLPQGELLVLPGCGHFAPRERPAELSTIVERFLARVLYTNREVEFRDPQSSVGHPSNGDPAASSGIQRGEEEHDEHRR
jgi:pimeloyl-ACP methyl ester carboxylesterase